MYNRLPHTHKPDTMSQCAVCNAWGHQELAQSQTAGPRNYNARLATITATPESHPNDPDAFTKAEDLIKGARFMVYFDYNECAMNPLDKFGLSS